MTCHAFEQNSARERSLFLARPHGTLSLLISETKSAQLVSYLQEEIEKFLFLPGV